LRRIGRDHADPQLAQCPPHLRQTVGIDRFSGLRGQPEMAAAIAVQGAEQAFPLDHFPERRHHCQRRFLFHQLRVIDLAGSIVQNHD